MRPKLKRQLINAVGIFLSALFLYFCFHSLDREALKQAFLLPHPWLLVGVLAMNLPLMWLKALMWQILLRPIQVLPIGTLFEVLHIGYMGNNLLPLKAGEFFRASFVSKKWSLPYTQVLTTVGLERYFAGFSLILILIAVASFLPIPVWIKSGAYVLGAVLLGVQIVLMFLWKKQLKLENWETRHPVIYRIIEFFYHVGEGSQPLRSLKSFSALFVLALLTWLIQGAMLILIERAFDVRMSLAASFFVLVAINLAISLPSAPSNIGTFEFAAVLALTWLGLGKATALGIGFYFHILTVIPVTLLGLYYYYRWGIRLTDLEAAVDKKAEAIHSL